MHIYNDKFCFFIYRVITNHQKQPKKGHLGQHPCFSFCFINELCMHYKWQCGVKVSLEQHRLENYTICLNNIYYWLFSIGADRSANSCSNILYLRRPFINVGTCSLDQNNCSKLPVLFRKRAKIYLASIPWSPLIPKRFLLFSLFHRWGKIGAQTD